MEMTVSKKLLIKEVLFWTCFFVYTVFSFYLFYSQAATSDSRFHSDMQWYIKGVLGTNERDPYPYRLFFWVVGALNVVFPIKLSAAFGTVLFNSATVFILKHYIEKYFTGQQEGNSNDRRSDALYMYGTAAAVFSSLTASMIIIPFNVFYKFEGQYYIGQGSGNLWHNATYLATRPFATVAFFLFIEILKEINGRVNIKKYIIFAASMFLSVFAKPTFAIVMIPTAAVMLAATLVTARFRNFRNVFFASLTFVPALLDGLRQYMPVFGSDRQSGIGFGFGDVWKQYTNSIPVSIILCFAFTIYIFICNLKNKDHRILMLFSFSFLIVALFEGVFLYEKGIRMPDGNFLQGYLHAMFFLFIVSLIIWLTKNPGKKKSILYNIFAALLFLMHTVSGIWYFIHLIQGNSFY